MTAPMRVSAKVTAVHSSTSLVTPSTVDVSMLGGTSTGLRYPVWYTPQVGDLVIVDWLGSQPYVAVVFF